MTAPIRLLLVCEENDEHGLAVAEEAARRSVPTARCCVSDLRLKTFTADPAACAVSGRSFERGMTVWWRRSGSLPVADLERDEAELQVAEAHALFLGALLAAQPRWVDEPFVGVRARHKAHQLVVARSVGVSVPDTIITNDPAMAADFIAKGPCVTKSVSTGPGLAPFTESVTVEDLPYVAVAPVLLQRRIDAVADVRLVVSGELVHVWQRSRAPGDLDWRSVDPAGAEFIPIDNGGWEVAVSLTKALGLSCAVQDWVIDTDGRRVFLEVNVEGHWLFLPGARERVTPALVEHLLSDG